MHQCNTSRRISPEPPPSFNSPRGIPFATLDWVDWFNHRRLLEPIGYLPPAEYEARYHEQAAVA